MRHANIGLSILLIITPLGFPVADSVGAFNQPIWDDPCKSHPTLCRFEKEKLPYIMMVDDSIDLVDYDGPDPGGC